ncbi:MAG TPA: DUF3822 family protein [Chitinophagales bacterium]|nr:DUF3822 family protein [Chitinophagales bacterium]
MTVAQVKNTFSKTGDIDSSIPPSSLELKISVSMQAIRYVVHSLTHGQVIFFGEYILHHVEDGQELIRRIEKIYENDEVLQLNFARVVVGLGGPYLLSPPGIDIEMNPLQGATLKQLCHNNNVELVYSLDFALSFKLRELFTASRFSHLCSPLFQQVDMMKMPDALYVNISSAYFDVLRIDNNGQVRLLNRYEFKASSDFIYFLLLCAQELQAAPEKVTLVLSGEIEERSEIYDLCYRYFRNPQFAQTPPGITFSKAFENFPQHRYYNLINLQA